MGHLSVHPMNTSSSFLSHSVPKGPSRDCNKSLLLATILMGSYRIFNALRYYMKTLRLFHIIISLKIERICNAASTVPSEGRKEQKLLHSISVTSPINFEQYQCDNQGCDSLSEQVQWINKKIIVQMLHTKDEYQPWSFRQAKVHVLSEKMYKLPLSLSQSKVTILRYQSTNLLSFIFKREFNPSCTLKGVRKRLIYMIMLMW